MTSPTARAHWPPQHSVVLLLVSPSHRKGSGEGAVPLGILQIQQVKSRLEAEIIPHIDVSDLSAHSEANQKPHKLTRALTAFVMMKRSALGPAEAAQSVVDGGTDNGIDGIAVLPDESKIILVQTKWSDSGKGSAELAEMLKFREGVNDLLSMRWHKFNAKVQARVDELQAVLMKTDIKVDIVFAHMGTGTLAPDVEAIMSDFVADQNDSVSDSLSFTYLGQTQIHRLLVEEQQAGDIDLDVTLSDWGAIEGPPTALYGHIQGSEVAAWLTKNGEQLLAKNVRVFLGDSEVNKSVKETALTTPELFWYFNNGITVLCKSYEKTLARGTDRRIGNYVVKGASVVNGAQTVGSLASLSTGPEAKKLDHVRVAVRFISLDDAEEDFGSRVTRATNTQNRIGGRDFVGLDPEQDRLRNEFAVDGLVYAVRSGETDPEDAAGCSFDEAVVALACSSDDVNLSTQAKREISRLYLDTSRAPYRSLFNGQTTSTAVWRRVRVLRHVDSYLASPDRNWSDSREKGFAVHGNRLLLHLVFTQLNRKILDDPGQEWQLDGSAIDRAAELAYQFMKEVTEEKYDGYLASLFKNAAKVKIIRDEAVTRIASTTQVVSTTKNKSSSNQKTGQNS